MLLFYVALLVVSLLSGLAGIYSLVGVRSRQKALAILPAALLGIFVSGCNISVCLMAFLLEGRNLSG